MISFILQSLALASIAYASWFYIRRSAIKASLSNVRGPLSPSFLAGHIPQLFSWDFLKSITTEYGNVVKIKGVCGSDMTYISDAKALYYILIKDEDIFEETHPATLTYDLVFGSGVLSAIGHRHKKQRKMLNPLFSAKHISDMLPTFYDVTRQLRDVMDSKLSDGPRELDVLDWMSRTALELIGRTGLGYSFHGLVEGSSNPYRDALKNVEPAISRLAIFRLLLPLLVKLGPPKFRKFLVRIFPSKNVQAARECIDTMANVATELLDAKKQAIMTGDATILEEIGQGKDLMSTLLRANMEASHDDKLSDEELLGQMSTFLFAATDTTSGAVAHILQLLADNIDVQEKLRHEVIQAYQSNEELSYDDITALPYMDAVIKETLRRYPPLCSIGRTCRKDTVLPLSKPIKGCDGNDIHEITMLKGTDCIAGLFSANVNPDVWGEDADQWKPERWLSPLPQSVISAHMPGIYSHLMTFLGGTRACIGYKFSVLEMKVLLSVLLRSFSFSSSGKEIYWALSLLQAPFVKGAKTEAAQMPLVITRL